MGKEVLNYELIHKIEEKYDSLTNCPEDDKDLQQLRREMGIKVSQKYRSEMWREQVKNKQTERMI